MNSHFWIPAFFTVLVAAGIDVRSRRIPNWLSVPSLVVGVAASTVVDGPGGLRRSLLGVAVAAVFFGAQCWLGSMGMGDLKLGAAMGAWIGPSALVFALLIAAMAGGILAMGYCWSNRSMSSLLDKTGGLLTAVPSRKALRGAMERPKTESIPYAPAMAAGVMVSMFANWR